MASIGSGQRVLPDDEVHVWRVALDMTPSDLALLEQINSQEERARADRFRFDVDRRRSIIGRGCLRLLLGHILGSAPNNLEFGSDKFGKPVLAAKYQNVQFNISHSGDLIAVAITRGRAVGVDIEQLRTDIDIDNIAETVFSLYERKTLASLIGASRYQAFFACWTRKEAYLKAKGVGLSLPLDQFDVSLLPDQEPRLLATRNAPGEAEKWRLVNLDLPSSYAGALAAEGMHWKLKYWNWDEAPGGRVIKSITY